MRIKLVLFFCFISITAFAQNGITFEVEELSKPEIWLSTRSCDDIYKELILSDVNDAGTCCDHGSRQYQQLRGDAEMCR